MTPAVLLRRVHLFLLRVVLHAEFPVGAQEVRRIGASISVVQVVVLISFETAVVVPQSGVCVF